MPVPVRLTVCGLPDALSVMVSVPVSEPVAVGEKVTLIVQKLLAATLPPQLSLSPKLALGSDAGDSERGGARVAEGDRLRRARRPHVLTAERQAGWRATLAIGRACSVVTWNGTLLLSVALVVVTWTIPVVAPVGTVVSISVSDTTVNVAAVPLKLTPLALVRLLPRIMTAAPTPADVGTVCTKGPSPIERLKTVPPA